MVEETLVGAQESLTATPEIAQVALSMGLSRRAFLQAAAAVVAAGAIGGARPASAATLPSATPGTADSLIAVAATQVGYRENGDGTSKYGIWYGLPAGEWCAMFVSWCAEQAGLLGTVIPSHSYTPEGRTWFARMGRWHDSQAGIARGDIVYFDFPKGFNRIEHVGIVESVTGSIVNTIEGNTSTTTGSQTTGGTVARKSRSAYIVGYGRPAYAGAPPAPTPQEDDMASLIRSTNGTIALVGPGPQMIVLRTMTEVEALQATGQVTGTWIQLPDGLIWDTCKAIATRAGQFTA